MSANIIAFACQTKQRPDVIRTLKQKEADTPVTEFWARIGEFMVGDLTTGWSVFLTKDEKFSHDESMLKRMALKSTLYVADIIEVGPYSRVAEFTKGNLVWSITFDGPKKSGLEYKGRLPSAVQAIRNDLLDDSRVADPDDRAFSVAPGIFKKLTGYNYEDPYDPAIITLSLKFLIPRS